MCVHEFRITRNSLNLQNNKNWTSWIHSIWYVLYLFTFPKFKKKFVRLLCSKDCQPSYCFEKPIYVWCETTNLLTVMLVLVYTFQSAFKSTSVWRKPVYNSLGNFVHLCYFCSTCILKATCWKRKLVVAHFSPCHIQVWLYMYIYIYWTGWRYESSSKNFEACVCCLLFI